MRFACASPASPEEQYESDLSFSHGSKANAGTTDNVARSHATAMDFDYDPYEDDDDDLSEWDDGSGFDDWYLEEEVPDPRNYPDVDGKPYTIWNIEGWDERIFKAAARGNVAAVQRLLDAGVSPCRHGGSAFIIACELGFAPVVELMLTDGRVAAWDGIIATAVGKAATICGGRSAVLEVLLTHKSVKLTGAAIAAALDESAAPAVVSRVLAHPGINAVVLDDAARSLGSDSTRCSVSALEQLLAHPAAAAGLSAAGLVQMFEQAFAVLPPSPSAIALAERLVEHANWNPAVFFCAALVAAVRAGQVHLVDRMLRDPRVDPTHLSKDICIAARLGGAAVSARLLDDHRIDPCAWPTMLSAAVLNEDAVLVGRIVGDPRCTEACKWMLLGALKELHSRFQSICRWREEAQPGSSAFVHIPPAMRQIADQLLSHPLLQPQLEAHVQEGLTLRHAGTVELLLAKPELAVAKGMPVAWKIQQAALAAAVASHWQRNDLADRLLAHPLGGYIGGVTPAMKARLLSTAADAGNVGFLSRMLADAYVHAAACDKALQAAVDSEQVACIAVLLRHARVDPSKRNNEPLRRACEHARAAAAALLVEDPRVDPGAASSVAFVGAAVGPRRQPLADRNSLADTYAVRRQLWPDSLRCELWADAQHAIATREADSRLSIMELLLQDPRVDASARSNTALRGALRRRQVGPVELLLTLPSVWRAALPSRLRQRVQACHIRHDALAAGAAARAWSRRRAAVLAYMPAGLLDE